MGIIVIADTHFGLKKGKTNMGMPGYLAQFLEWVNNLDKEPPLQVVEGSIREENIKLKNISPPEKIIFLGDMLELWDSEDETLAANMLTLLSTLSNVNAEKIYVLGNHDDILTRAVLKNPHTGEYMDYPLGNSSLKVFPDRYPPVTSSKKAPAVLTYGNENYIFVHGHQFDKDFTGPLTIYKTYPLMRTVSNSLTIYVPVLLAASFLTGIINWVFNTSFLWGDPHIICLLFALSIPWIGTSGARPFWAKISGMKYRKEETIKSFSHWWKKLSDSEELPENVNVVYGHTHFLNYIPSPKHEKTVDNEKAQHKDISTRYRENLQHLGIEEKNIPALVNISGWITDFTSFGEVIFRKSEKTISMLEKSPVKVKNYVLKREEERKKDRLNPELVTVATFLYIDEDGFEFFGWNWYSDDPDRQKVFNIPKAAIRMRREQGCVTDKGHIRSILEKIGWPEHVLSLWAEDPHLQ